jgi:hypothetical protein
MRNYGITKIEHSKTTVIKYGWERSTKPSFDGYRDLVRVVSEDQVVFKGSLADCWAYIQLAENNYL